MAAAPQKLEQKARAVLGGCALFRDLPTEARDQLAGRATFRSYRPRQTIFAMGAEGNSLMALLVGKVRISLASPEGKEITLATLKPGEVFGEIALLDGRERTANAVAVTECRLAELSRPDVLQTLDRHPTAWHGIVRILCDRLRLTDLQIGEVALLPLAVRLSRTLLRMSEVELVAGRSVSRVHLSQREIGNLVGASRESINKVFHDWQTRGLIQIDGDAIAIVRRDLLERVA